MPERMEFPKADRVPRLQRIFYVETEHTLESDWTPLGPRDIDYFTTLKLFVTSGELVLPDDHNRRGDITVSIRGVDTRPATVTTFFVGVGSTTVSQYLIPRDPDVPTNPLHFFENYDKGCAAIQVQTVEGAYPPSAIYRNVLDNPDSPGIVLHVVLLWRGPQTGYGCDEDTSEAKVELRYWTDSTVVEPEVLDEPLDLWDENVCTNVVYLPAIPRRDHPEFGEQPRRIGFLQDREAETGIPGMHHIPENFLELFSAHRTRMVEEEPAFTNAITRIARSAPQTLSTDSDRVTRFLITGIPVIPTTGNLRGAILVYINGVDVSEAQPTHYFHVRFGAVDNETSYDIPAGSALPEFEFFPFFYRHTTERDCNLQAQFLQSAYPPRAIFDNVTEAADGTWALVVSLKWQGPAGFFGQCGELDHNAQIELHYQVFEGPETPTEVCKHSYASVVIGADGFARGLFCSKSDFLLVREMQENHFAHAFVNRGTVDFSEPVDGQKDFSVSQQVPPGMCGFIGGYHAPRWTELLFYSRRPVCREIL